MPAQHDDLAGFVRPGKFADHVVGGRALGERLVDDVELQADGFAVGQQAIDAAVVLVAQHHGGRRLGEIEGAVVEGADLSVFARRVVDAQQRLVGHQPRVHLRVDLRRRQFAGLRRSGAAAGAESAASRIRVVGVELFLDLFVVAPQGRGAEVDGHHGRLARPARSCL